MNIPDLETVRVRVTPDRRKRVRHWHPRSKRNTEKYYATADARGLLQATYKGTVLNYMHALAAAYFPEEMA